MVQHTGGFQDAATNCRHKNIKNEYHDEDVDNQHFHTGCPYPSQHKANKTVSVTSYFVLLSYPNSLTTKLLMVYTAGILLV